MTVYLEVALPRVSCPEHGVVTAAVPWAIHRAGRTWPFDETVAWFVAGVSKKLIAQLLRIYWHTVGSVLQRVMAERDGQDNRTPAPPGSVSARPHSPRNNGS